jgi:hypothetical protein
MLSRVFAFGGTETEIQRRFAYTGVQTLIVENAAGFTVKIKGSSSETLEADIRAPKKQGIVVKHEKLGSTLRVWVEWPNGNIRLGFTPLEMEFQVPRTINADVETSSGNVDLSDIRGDTVRIATSSGNITVKQVTARYLLQSTSGNQWLMDSSGDKQLKSSSGSITVLRSDGNIMSRSSSGDHKYEKIRGTLEAESTSGDIDFADLEGALRLLTSTGRQTGRNIAVAGDSSFRSTSGSIDVDFNVALEGLAFDLEASSGKLIVGTAESEDQLLIEGGDIRITGRTISGDQSFR